MKRLSILLGLFALLASAAPFPNVCVNCWYEIPSSNLSSVAPSPIPHPGTQSGYYNFSGAWYDTQRDRLVVWGGGHSDYYGNEVYAFYVDSLKWFRIKDPATTFDGTETSGYYNNGGAQPDSQQPVARHTYNALAYCKNTDRYLSLGATATSPSAAGANVVNLYNPNNNTWSQTTQLPMNFFNTVISDWDDTTQTVWFHGNGSSCWLAQFNCATGTYTNHGDIFNDGNINSGVTGIVIPYARRFFATGNNVTKVYDMTIAGQTAGTTITGRGSTRIRSALRPGLAYCPDDSSIVGWHGTDTVSRYKWSDTATGWVDVPPSVSNTVNVSSPNAQGTAGRWRRITGVSGCVFIVTNSPSGSTYLYRYTAAAAASTGPPNRKSLLGVGR